MLGERGHRTPASTRREAHRLGAAGVLVDRRSARNPRDHYDEGVVCTGVVGAAAWSSWPAVASRERCRPGRSSAFPVSGSPGSTSDQTSERRGVAR
jgi:hypothetical protein